MAAIVRTQSRLNIFAPPPSPIANAKGLKSAAVNDEILSEYLDKTLQIPSLSLPESYFPVNNDHHRSSSQIPAEVDLNSLISRDGDSIRKLLESVTKFGVFRLIGHGISDEELRSVVRDAELVFRISKEKKRNRDLSVSFGLKKVNREELVWLRTEKEKEEDVTLREEIGSDRYRSFSMKMDGIYDRLQVIAGSVGQILLSYMKQPQEKGIRNREPVLCVYRYTHDRFEEDQLTPKSGHPEQVKKNAVSFDHALSLYVSIGDQQFHVDTGNGSLSFNTCSGAIVGTIRKLEEWSQGEFKRVQGEPILKRGIDDSPSYSIEFMFTPSTLNYNPGNDQNPKTEVVISLFDQFMIAIAIVLLYTVLTYIL